MDVIVFLWTINCMMQSSVRNRWEISMHVYHMFYFCCSVTWDLWQKTTFHVFARIQNIAIHSILLYGSMDNIFFLLWLWHELWLKLSLKTWSIVSNTHYLHSFLTFYVVDVWLFSYRIWNKSKPVAHESKGYRYEMTLPSIFSIM